MDYIAAEIEIALFVTERYTDITTPQYPYHNLAPTQSVVGHASRTTAFYFLNDYDGFVLKADVQIVKVYFSSGS
jgi:hypothetical protein